jgi:hypothetical protein
MAGWLQISQGLLLRQSVNVVVFIGARALKELALLATSLPKERVPLNRALKQSFEKIGV